MLRRALLVLTMVVTAGSVLAACGGGDDGDGAGKPAPLEGTEWVLDQKATQLETLAPSVVVTARFADGRLSGNSGCNQYSTSFTTRGSRLTVSGPIAGTLMACSPPASNVEAAYLELLPTARRYSISGKTLTIATATSGVRLVYRAVQGEDAVAGSWDATSYFRPGAIVSVINGTTITAEFADGTVSGDSGCNRYSGSYEVSGSKITIGPIASTQRACADPAVDQQETDYLAALALARSFSLDRGGLTLLRADGGIAVMYSRA